MTPYPVFEIGQRLQPMDQPEKAGNIVAIRIDADANRYQLENNELWYHEDELEIAD